MSDMTIGVVGIVVMLVLMMLEVPVWVSVISVGFVGFSLVGGFSQSLSLIGLIPTSTISDYSIAVFPLFLLMGEFADISGMMRKAYNAANAILGHLPGGLAMASIVGAAVFSAISGSSMACSALMGRVALPQLIDHKYDPKLATGALCAGGTLGNLIPPGILLCFYAVISGTSLGDLFAACMIPGILLTIMYCVQIYIQCKRNPLLGPRAEPTTWKQKRDTSIGGSPLIIVFIIVMGGILLGYFTPSEAAAIGTILVFIYAIIMKSVNSKTMTQSLKNSLTITGMAFGILIATRIFTSFIAITGLSQASANWVIGLNLSPISVVIIMMLVYFVLGIAMDSLTMLLLTTPIFVAILATMHVDLVWFGVLVITQMELSQITPPIGMNLFIIAGMGKERGITMGDVFSGSLPFCVTMLIFNVILVAFPQLSMWLPSLMHR
jgi:C4-dicarboxylate transporter DctM subunit